jgi:hypothetical protein
MSNHPEQSDLLRYIDGELTARKSRQVERHVEACWDCRAEIEELKKTVAECVRYRKEFLAEALPGPPQPWNDIYAAFVRIDREAPQPNVLVRFVRGAGLHWAAGAATAALAIAGAIYFGGTPLMRKAPAPGTSVQEPRLLRNSAGSGAAPLEVPLRPAVPSRPAAIVPGPTASISDELRVVQALHGIGADLGDPLHVSLSNGRVLVAGAGIAPERQRQIETALDSLPRVAVEFSEPAVAPLPAEGAPPASTANSPDASPFQARVENQLGGRGAADRFTSEVLNWNETLMSHAYALRALAQKFPEDAPLNDADRASLRGLALDHLNAMAVPAGNYAHAMVPLLTALGATAPASSAAPAASWQASAEQLFQAARSVEMLSSKLLGVARGEKANADLPSELLGAVSDLRAGLERDQRLLGR